MPILKKSESNFTPVPVGVHPARCYAMVSIGTQPSRNPKYEPSFQVVLQFEFPNEQIEIDGVSRPMAMSQFLNAYLGSPNKPSNTNKFLSAWRGRAFTEAELDGFDLSKVVGAPGLLNVIHEQKDGKTNAKILSISPLPKGMTMSGQLNPPIIYEIEQGEDKTFQSLPEWLQKMIRTSAEFNKAARAHEAPPASPAEPESDDVPF